MFGVFSELETYSKRIAETTATYVRVKQMLETHRGHNWVGDGKKAANGRRVVMSEIIQKYMYPKIVHTNSEVVTSCDRSIYMSDLKHSKC